MTKRGVTFCLFSLILTVYLVISLVAANDMAASAGCAAWRVSVEKRGEAAFVTPDDIILELKPTTDSTAAMPVARVDLQAVEDRLESLTTVEKANVYRLSDNVVRVDVTPMIPVARVFDRDKSYYINRDGKQLTADTRYQVDAPVVVGDFSKGNSPHDILPLLRRVDKNPVWSRLVSSYMVAANGDIIIVPSINGHLVNFGDTTAIDDKFARLMAFYRQVMPVKGWSYYDTVTVKFARQVVASVAPGSRVADVNIYSDEDFIEDPDDQSMTSDDTDINNQKPKL